MYVRIKIVGDVPYVDETILRTLAQCRMTIERISKDVEVNLIVVYPFIAHTSPGLPDQPYDDHASAVANLAAAFASVFGASEQARVVGLLHDSGKMNPAWIAYARGQAPQVEHAIVGAILAKSLRFPIPLAWIMACHHTGLQDFATFVARLQEHEHSPTWKHTLDLARTWFQSYKLSSPVYTPSWKQATQDKTILEVYTRMLFSCLVDADYLDTEAYYRPDNAFQRQRNYPSILRLWRRFLVKQTHFLRKQKQFDSPLNRVRTELYYRCLAAAEIPTSMTLVNANTGWGKSRASIGYALRHSLIHDKRRIIVVIPYISIVQQSSTLLRELLGDDAVIEHHSMVQDSEHDEDRWQRAAIENWDAPIIVTTTVQFFQSLFANRSSACRKLHNIANSVVILDEVQMLPIVMLLPIRSMMHTLMSHFGVTFLASSATPFTERVWQAMEPDRPLMIQTVELPILETTRPPVQLDLSWLDREVTWEEVAAEMEKHRQVLTVVNTRKDARDLYALLRHHRHAIHVSRYMCGKHVQRVLRKIRLILHMKCPVCVIATSLIEVGVDLDFPFGMRAEAPLDRLIQFMGRIDRNALHGIGRLQWFRPVGTKIQPSYQIEAEATRTLLKDKGSEAVSPKEIERYFHSLVRSKNTDIKGIESIRRNRDSGIQFEQIADGFRIIDEDEGGNISLLVLYDNRAKQLLDSFRHSQKPTRSWIRAIQPYLVSVHAHHAVMKQTEKLEELLYGVYLWKGEYDAQQGLVWE